MQLRLEKWLGQVKRSLKWIPRTHYASSSFIGSPSWENIFAKPWLRTKNLLGCCRAKFHFNSYRVYRLFSRHLSINYLNGEFESLCCFQIVILGSTRWANSTWMAAVYQLFTSTRTCYGPILTRDLLQQCQFAALRSLRGLAKHSLT